MEQIIVGRKNEIKQIEKYYKSGKAEFIAVYGRRRVGKTFLIRQYFKNRFAFDMTGVMEGSKAEQMTAFHAALKTYGYKGTKNKNWIDAFFALRQLLESKIEEGKRCVVFIDELPCLDTQKAGFVNALGHFWNNWANWQSEIMLIVCGSATSWMVRNIIDNHGGLHDRITHEIHLHPFTLSETEEFFTKNGNFYQISDNVKKCVTFKQHNLLKDPYPTGMHLIVCRNVLIYFTEEAKDEIFEKYYRSLADKGVLFIGSTEQILKYKEIGYKRMDSFFYRK